MDLVEVSQREQLAAIERIIRESLAQGRAIVRQIGSGLLAIYSKDLWMLEPDDRRDFLDYCYDAFGMEARSVKAAMDTERAFRLLEARHLRLPANDSQAQELARLDDDHLPVVWQRVIEMCEENHLSVTVSRVRQAVDQERDELRKEARQEAILARKKKKGDSSGVIVDMGEDDELLLSEKGEEALARIQALCGEQIATAIRSRANDKVTEDSLIQWAGQDDAIVQALPYYVIDKLWGVRKSLNYLSQILDGDTEVDELVLMARNRGGRFSGVHEEARITVEIMGGTTKENT